MKKFLTENWFKLAILIVILIIGGVALESKHIDRQKAIELQELKNQEAQRIERDQQEKEVQKKDTINYCISLASRQAKESLDKQIEIEAKKTSPLLLDTFLELRDSGKVLRGEYNDLYEKCLLSNGIK